MTSLRERLKKIPLAIHLYRMLKVVCMDPLNQGLRTRFLWNYLKWYLYQKPRGKKVQISLLNGMKSWVYADSDAGVSYLFTRNVDYYDDLFIRKIVQPGDFIIDAGCNVGNRLLALADIVGGALLLDANPLCLERLEENLLLNGINTPPFHRRAKAVSSEPGFLYFSNLGATHCSNQILTEADAQSGQASKVPVTTIDSEMHDLGNPICSFIKLDLEGYDLQGLQGAIETITHNQVRLIKFERWQRTPLTPFERFFQDLDWVLFTLDEQGQPSLNSGLIQQASNLFAMPRPFAETLVFKK